MKIFLQLFALTIAVLLIESGDFLRQINFFSSLREEKKVTNNKLSVNSVTSKLVAKGDLESKILRGSYSYPLTWEHRFDQASLRSGVTSLLLVKAMTGIGSPGLQPGEPNPGVKVDRNDRSNATTAETRRPHEGRLGPSYTGRKRGIPTRGLGDVSKLLEAPAKIISKHQKQVKLSLMGAPSTSVSVRHLF